MSSLTQEKRLELLRSLSQMGSQGRAEGENAEKLPRSFYPVSEHLRALNEDVALVVGPRGSGKTEMFRAVTDANMAGALSRYSPSRALAGAETKWLKAYPLEREGFDAHGLREFLTAHPPGTDHAEEELWFAYLVRCVKDEIDSSAQAALRDLLGAPGGDAKTVHAAWANAGQERLLALDRLDKRLEADRRYVVVSYDELDVVAGRDWEAMTRAIQGLVAFWADYARRWRRLRAKIFLRTDLFERFATKGGADLAKLAAGRVELAWSDRHLYGMLLKRIANTNEELKRYLQEVRSQVQWNEDASLGWLPTLERWTDARPIIERMIGPYMGKNVKKGLTYRWLLAHVRDGRDRAVPRPLVRLIEEAAREEANHARPVRGMRVLHPTSLRLALDRVSEEHVAHARDEWRWIDGLRARLEALQVPCERRDVERAFGDGASWTGSVDAKPPFDDPRDLLDYVLEVGILRERPDGRIDAPDLFLHGLGLKRKGGVRRR